MSASTTRNALGLALACGLIVLAYVPSFSVPFVFDDAPNIVFNQKVQPETLGELWQSLDARGERDRPVAMFTFALNYLYGGLDTDSYHAVNLAIHLANTALLFLLLVLLTRAPRSPPRLGHNALYFAAAVALLWALHPVNTQAVTYIVQRMASLAAMFYLAGLLVFVLWRSRMLATVPAAIGFSIALLAGFGTKANVATLPLAVLLIDVALYSGFRRVHGLILGAVAIVGAAVVILYAGPQLAYLFEAPPHRDFSGIERLMTQGRVVCHYLSLVFWPDADRLQLDYDFSVSRGLLDPPATLLAAGFLAALTVLAIVNLRRHPWPALGWLFFLLALSVESTVVLLELAFEHRIYLPATLLLAGLLAPVFARIGSEQARRNVFVGVLVIAGLLAWQTVERNRQWQDLGGLWSADLERGASPYRAALNGGIGHLRAGRADRAMELFDLIEARGLATKDRQRAKIAQLRGEAHFAEGRFAQALESFRAALRLNPGWTRSAYFSAIALLQLDGAEGAADILEQMRAHDPDSIFTVSLQAQLLADTESVQQGIDHLRTYLADSDRVTAVNRSFLQLQIGNMYRDAGNWREAARHYREAMRHSSGNWAARLALDEMEARLESEQDAALPR